MKIVRIIARLNVGGPARHVVWLTGALQGKDFETVLLTGKVPAGEENMGYFAAENGVEPVFIEQMSRELSPQDVISLWKVYRHIRREQPDIIHTHTAKAGTIGRVAGFLYRWFHWRTLLGRPRPVRLVHTYHGHVFHSYYGRRKTAFFLLIEKTLARLATDRIIVISRRQFEEIHGTFGVGRRQQFEIIPLGIDLEPFQAAPAKRAVLREELGAGDDQLVVGLVGRLTEIKNISLFLEVAKIYAERKKSSIPQLRFVIIGDGHLRKPLEAEAELLGVAGTVEFLGNRDDAGVFYAGLDIVALTSLNEGTPLSLIEAMAARKAVIATNVGGVPDLLGEIETDQDGFAVCRRGLRVSSMDAEDLYKGLVHLAENANLRQKLGSAGEAFVRENYARERLVGDIEKLYRNLTADS